MFREDRSAFESLRRPRGNKNPGDSRIIEELDSLPLKGQGFLGNADQPRVSWSVTILLTGVEGKGEWLIFHY